MAYPIDADLTDETRGMRRTDHYSSFSVVFVRLRLKKAQNSVCGTFYKGAPLEESQSFREYDMQRVSTVPKALQSVQA